MMEPITTIRPSLADRVRVLERDLDYTAWELAHLELYITEAKLGQYPAGWVENLVGFRRAYLLGHNAELSAHLAALWAVADGDAETAANDI